MAKSVPLGSRWGKPVEEEEEKKEKSPPAIENENENKKSENISAAEAAAATTAEAKEDANENKETLSSEKKRRKRKSRWETAANEEGEKATTTTPNSANNVSVKRNAPLPGTIVISGGLRVQIPAALLGVRSMPKDARDDPELEVMFKDLETCNRNCLIGAPFSEEIFLDKREVLKTKNSKYFPKEVEENMKKPKDDAPPVYDAQGHRVSSKSELHRDKYDEKRGRLIEEIARRCPQFTPPADYLPSRKRRKIYIPVEEHPGYNFFGLIIGPRGNTQKKMQMETNTKIVVRGRGAAKEGSGKQDVSIDEPLHVLVEGDSMVDIDRACEMIEKLLIPVDENMNEHKREQLRQLAIMNGTLREVDEQELRLQQEEENALLYQLPDHIKAQTDEVYRKDMERLHGSGNGLEDKYSDFLSEIGVDPNSLGARPGGVTYAGGEGDQFNPVNAKISGLGAGARAAPASSVGIGGSAPQTGAFSGNTNPDDKNKLYVANLPPHVTNEQLRPIFEKFGRVTACDVVPDREKQLSCRGFAFITFATEVEARSAIPHTNGMTIEGRVVETRIKNEPKVPIYNASGGGDAAQEDVNEDAKLYVANLPQHYEEEDLKTLFSPYGLVQSVKIVSDHSTGLSKGYGFVQMMDQEQALSAIAAVNGNMVEGCTKPLVVNIASDKKRGLVGNGFGGAPMMPMMDAATAAYYYQQQQMAMYGYQQYEQQYVVPEGIEVGDMNGAPAPPPPPEMDAGVPGVPSVPVPPPPDHGVILDDLPPPPPPPP